MLPQRAAAAEAQILREAAYAAELQAMQQRSAQLTAQAASQVQQELQQKLGAKQEGVDCRRGVVRHRGLWHPLREQHVADRCQRLPGWKWGWLCDGYCSAARCMVIRGHAWPMQTSRDVGDRCVARLVLLGRGARKVP